MPKDPTPYQLSKNLQYVQKEAPFLAKLKAKHQDPVKKKFEDWNPEGDDDEEYDELHGAQVVVLKEGKHYSEEDLQRHLRGEKVDLSKSKEEAAAADDEESDTPAVDEDGKLMFRQKKKPSEGQSSTVVVGSKPSAKRKQTDSTESSSDGNKKKNKKDKKRKESMLSFDVDEE
ncbi:hypothetical protein Unana1_01852 [Umbelopsis nana]